MLPMSCIKHPRVCKFGSFANPITSLYELYFRIFILLFQTKKEISMNYGSRTGSWKPWRWVRFDLILTIWDIYTNSDLNPLTKLTTSRRSTEFKDILSWNISQIIARTVPISTKIVISYVIKRDVHCKFDGKSMKTETTNFDEFRFFSTFLPEK